MTHNTESEIADIARQARELAARVPFDDRANILRTVAFEVRQAVKHDPTMGGAPEGRDWELEGLGLVCDAAENYFYDALRAKRS